MFIKVIATILVGLITFISPTMLIAQQNGEAFLKNKDNFFSPNYATILQETALSTTNYQQAIAILERYKGNINTLQGQSTIAALLASLYELTGTSDKAITLYNEAYVTSRPVNYTYLLRAGFLLAGQGQAIKGIEHAELAMQYNLTDSDKNQALTLFFTAARLGNLIDKANTMITNQQNFIKNRANASLYYALYRYYLATHQLSDADLIAKLLQNKYPQSPENLIIKGQYQLFPSPLNLF